MPLRRTFIVLLLASAALAVACNLYPNDQMWISEAKYESACQIYEETQSLEETEQALREDPKWRNPQINEALYRLKKFHRIED